MANSRIKDIATTAASAASDDYLVIDGATNGTRKISASNVGGSSMIDYTTTLTPAITPGSVGVYKITVVDSGFLTDTNASTIKAYVASSHMRYVLTLVGFVKSGSNCTVTLLNSSSSTTGGTLHIVAPFEISAVVISM